MLRYLRVANLAVVRDLSLELDEGLTALTGETGAGKSILVDAFTLLLGARASADLVRTGATAAAVEGISRVEGNTAAQALLAELGLEPEDGDVVLRREVAANGKGRAFVNGALHPVGTLRRLGAVLADVYGQLEHVRLLDPATHLELLDHVAGADPMRAEVGAAWRRLRDLDERLAALAASEAERARRADFLRYELGEIEDAKPVTGEEDSLRRERAVLANRTRVLELAEGGYQELYESEGAVLDRLTALVRRLEELGGYDPRLAGLALEVDGARVSLEDTALVLRDYARDVPLETGRLERVEQRLAVLDRLLAKYGKSLAEVLAFAEAAGAELKTLVVSAAERSAMEAERDEAREDYRRLAAEASSTRSAAARRLETRVEEELQELAMEKTRFRVRMSAGEPGPSGVDHVEFHVSTNVGEEPRALARVASGGELSRLLLAVRTVAADHDPARIAVFHGLEAGLASRVAVFDEVDAGIGGRVAYVLAKKLHRLAEGRQVLCITHLAPVAAAADHHVRVRKEEHRGRTEVSVERLAGAERAGELARMIAGDSVTDAVRRHAEELLASGPGR